MAVRAAIPTTTADALASAATGLGDAALAWPVLLVVVAGVAAGGSRDQAFRFALACGLTLVAILVAKLMLGSWRGLDDVGLRSPSGHAASAALAWGGAAMLMTGRRDMTVAAGAVAAAGVGWTRVALGMHSPQEALFGAAAGTIGLWAGSRGFPTQARPPPGVLAVCAAAIVMLVGMLHGVRAPIEPRLTVIEAALRNAAGE